MQPDAGGLRHARDQVMHVDARHRAATLGSEDVGAAPSARRTSRFARAGLLTLPGMQQPDLGAANRMGTGRTALQPVHVHRVGLEVV